MTKEEQMYIERAFHTTLAKSIIANQFAINLNDQLKHTKFYKGNVKLHGKPYTLALIKAEKDEFAKVDETDTNAVDSVFAQMDTLLEVFAKCPFLDYGEATIVIKALAKDSNSMVELAKLILK